MSAPSSFPLPVPPAIPAHSLLRCIGRGSYGEVWLARNQGGDYCAIKVVYRSTFENDRPFERELSGIQKFEPVSRTHPSQVHILQVGVNREEGYFYYAMELADDAGPSGSQNSPAAPAPNTEPIPARAFDARLVASYQPRTLKLELHRHHRLPVNRCLEIGLALSTALDHLHQHALIHRDIKPSNVIFVNGVPKLADIGLVTDVGGTISYVGTEGFLPPEGPGTPQADIYSLGKVLYELCTGRDRLDFPELPTCIEDPRSKDQFLEVNQILLKACQNDPRKRYASARDLFADLMLLKSGKSLRRVRAIEQQLARVRIIAAALALLIGGGAIVNHLLNQRQLQESRRAAEAIDKARRAVESDLQQTSRRLADLAAANGDRLLSQGDASGALLWFNRALAEESTDPERLAKRRQALATTWQQCPLPAWISTQPAGLRSFAVSRDGKRTLTVDGDRTVRTGDAATGEPIGQPMVHGERVVQADLSYDGERALTLTADGRALLWRQLTAAPFSQTLEPATALRRAEFGPEGRQILGLTTTGTVMVWEAGSRQLRLTLRPEGQAQAAVLSPDGRWIVTVDSNRVAQTWNLETGEAVASVPLALEAISGLVCQGSPSRRVAAWAGSRLQAWDARSATKPSITLAHEANVRSACFSPDGRSIVTGGDDQVVRIWDAVDGRAQGAPWRHPAPVRSLVFSPDGRFIAAAGSNQVQILRVAGSPTEVQFFTHPTQVVNVQFSSAGHLLFLAGADGTVKAIPFLASPLMSPGPSVVSPDAWRTWAELLSGRELSAEGLMVPLTADALRQRWRSLRPAIQSLRAPIQLADWHREQAEASESQLAWFAAGFHWARAAALRPEIPAYRERQGRAATLLAVTQAERSRPPGLSQRIPSRLEDIDARLLDLTAHYNGTLQETWLPSTGVNSGNDLSELKPGVHRFGNTSFDVRGILQLTGAALENLGGHFPREERDLPVKQHCRRLHFLHGTAWSALTGTHIATYRVHYANDETVEIRLRYGQHVREWWSPATSAPLTPNAAVAWEGENSATRALGMKVRLYQMTWINPLPAIEITTIDFVSTGENPAPFLLAITTE